MFFLANRCNQLLLFAIVVIPFVSACNRTCGGIKNRVPYPFGFSEGCTILLECINGTDIGIGGFQVLNVTPDNLLVYLPVVCDRPIESIQKLWSKRYALTWKNGFLLQNCSSSSGSVLPPAMLEQRLGLEACSRNGETISCFSKEDKGLMMFENVTGSRCRSLLSSFALEEAKNSVVALDFQTLELEWWIEGTCANRKCSSNGLCTDVPSTANRAPGFRCRCNDGFEGDGFRAGGSGCRKVSINCSALKYISGHCAKRNGVGVLIAGIFAGASLIAGLAIVCCFIRRRSTSLRTRKSARRLLAEAAGFCTVPFYPYREIEKATNGFLEKNMLGTGAYGTVYAGKLHNDEQVAVKKIRHRDNDGIEQVLNEIKLISSVSHPNLVRLLGCCIEKGEQILVYEFMPNGTLSQHLQRERGSGLPWTIRLTIAVETAKAIAHLHSAMNPPIYHRDIKSSNILLDYNFNSKVADFGLSRLGMTESSHISTAPQGTPGYVDPQYHQNYHLSDKSDVYSFGVVLVEIITALKVVDFSREQSEVNLAALAIDKIGKGCLDDIIDPLLEPHRDAWTLTSIHKMAELAFRCLAFHRDMRPSMMEVAAELEHLGLSGWATMEENIFVGSSESSCSRLSNGSENSRTTTKKSSRSQRLMVSQRSECRILMEEVKGCSPVSVQDPWFSEQSSPSSDSLLGKVI